MNLKRKNKNPGGADVAPKINFGQGGKKAVMGCIVALEGKGLLPNERWNHRKRLMDYLRDATAWPSVPEQTPRVEAEQMMADRNEPVLSAVGLDANSYHALMTAA